MKSYLPPLFPFSYLLISLMSIKFAHCGTMLSLSFLLASASSKVLHQNNGSLKAISETPIPLNS